MVAFAALTTGQLTKLGVGSVCLLFGVMMVLTAQGFHRRVPRTNAGTTRWEEHQKQGAWFWAVGGFCASAYFFSQVFPRW